MNDNNIIQELMGKNFELSRVLHSANVAANFAGFAAIGNDPGKVILAMAAIIATQAERLHNDLRGNQKGGKTCGLIKKEVNGEK